jgi:predicted PurR-regulated permease PerM
MATAHDPSTARASDIAAWLLAGLLVDERVHLLAPRLKMVRIRQEHGQLAAVALLALGGVLLLTFAVVGSVACFRSEAGSLPTLLHKMAASLESWRTVLPAGVVEQLPEDVGELQATAVAWWRAPAGALQHAGAEAARTVAHLLLGLGIGAVVALHDVQPPETLGPLAHALQARASRLGEAFRRVVFAQVRISAANTILTALSLVVALPIAGGHLPLARTRIAVTVVVGLLPVVGHLVANTSIVILSLGVSLSVAVVSLVFLIVIHKLEYVLNVHLVGTQVHAHAWEWLLAMLVLEAAFGIPGVIAAPISYAYLKDALVSRKLVEGRVSRACWERGLVQSWRPPHPPHHASTSWGIATAGRGVQPSLLICKHLSARYPNVAPAASLPGIPGVSCRSHQK